MSNKQLIQSDKQLYAQLNKLETEQRNPDTWNIDLSGSEEIVTLMNNEDKQVAEAIGMKKTEIALAVDYATRALSAGGRIIYAGAGTSGRLGIMDAAECPPTFGTDPNQVIGCIAGGSPAVFQAQEGAEDDAQIGIDEVVSIGVSENDFVCGLAASGRTPYVLGALKEARKRNAFTALVCCVSKEKIGTEIKVDTMIDIPVGPEVIMGSTRLKSATAQKMVCNMISTGAMIRLGKVYENVMVDLMLTNKKLVQRAIRIIVMFTGMEYEAAEALLGQSGGRVKVALVMALANLDVDDAVKRLEDNGGFVRLAIKPANNNRM